MIETDWKNDLAQHPISTPASQTAAPIFSNTVSNESLHIPAQQLDLRSHHRLPNPHHRKHPRKHIRFLRITSADTQQRAKCQTKHQRAPQVPVSNNPGTSARPTRLQHVVRIRPLLEGEFGVQHSFHLRPHGEDVARERVPDGLVKSVGLGATIIARDGGGESVRVEGCGGVVEGVIEVVDIDWREG